MIEVKGLSKHYGSVRAVDDVSFSVERGEIVGFLGPNGAGKSTTMKVLTCYLAPTGGTAIIDGHDIIDEPLKARSKVGYLPENTPLYEEMGVVEFLGYMARLEGVPKGQQRSRVDDLIDLCGIAKMAHKDIGALSKGYRQRVGLAQALMSDPPVLILDEPTSGLDPKQIVEIRGLIKTIAKDKAILLSTHILPEAQNTCTRILIISDGKLVGEGTSDALLEMAAGEERYTLALKGGDRGSIEAALRGLRGATNVTQLSANGELILKLTAERGTDLREAIFDAAVAQHAKLLQLEHESTSLEDVFLKLTGARGNAKPAGKKGEPIVEESAEQAPKQPDEPGGEEDA
jgi:ABC-2 type transport system ATP-binding protein